MAGADTCTPTAPAPSDVDLDALFVWSSIHGLASLLGSDMLPTLGFSDHQMQWAIAHCLARIGASLQPPQSELPMAPLTQDA